MGSSFDRTVPAGRVPFNDGFITKKLIEGQQPTTWDRLADFFRNALVYTYPMPFKYYTCYEFTVTALSDLWIDKRTRIEGRRGFAVVNHDPTLGNDMWLNSRAMTGVGQGMRITAVGGTWYAPVDSSQSVHIWPGFIGTTIGFAQFG